MNNSDFDAEIVSPLNSVEKDDNSSFAPPESDDLTSSISDVELKNSELDLELKKGFARHSLIITYVWLATTMLLFISTGILHACSLNFLSDSVLIALISGTSFSVVMGMVVTILRYLFSRK